MRLPLLENVLAPLAHLVAPPLCWGCGAPARAVEPLCVHCRAALSWQRRRTVRASGIETFAPVAYDGPAHELVRALKYRGARALAETMAAQMTANAPAGFLDGPRAAGAGPSAAASGGPLDAGPVLVPVPLHPARRRRRGFNQAALLAAAVGTRTGLAVCDCLERRSSAPAQVGRGRASRLAAADAAVRDVRLRGGAWAPRGRAVLVDDVVTTGATLAACAAALRNGGCRQVVALAYARTPGR